MNDGMDVAGIGKKDMFQCTCQRWGLESLDSDSSRT